MKPTKVRRRLQESLQDRRIATAVRDGFEDRLTDGFVIALTDDWVVLHTLSDGVHLDDVTMLRLEDVSRVWWRNDDAYHHRAIAAFAQEIASFACNLDVTASDLVSAAATRANIFAISFERLDQQPLCVGRLVSRRTNSFVMHFVGRDGVWAETTERWKYRHVTRVEVGGRYLTALNSFADPYPSPGEADVRNP